MKPSNSNQQILPKVLLHEHVEGSITPESAQYLANKYNVTLPEHFFYQQGEYDRDDFPNGRYRYDESDFMAFVKTYDVVANLLREPEDYAYILKDYLLRNAKQGLIYAEFISSAFHMCASYDEDEKLCWDAQRYYQILDLIQEAIDEVKNEYPIEVFLHACVVRHLPIEVMLASVQFIADHPHPLICGFNIAGNEKAGQFGDFITVHELIAQLHLPKSYHAGEICGPDSIRQAIRFGAQRIGHGIAAIEDDELIEELIKNKITLEVAPTSNRILVPYLGGSLAKHPLRKLYERGVRVTINTDDAGLFGTDMGKEFRIAEQQFIFQRVELLDVTLCGLEASFSKEQLKQKLIDRIYQEFTVEDSTTLVDMIETLPQGALRERLAERLAVLNEKYRL